MATLPNYYRSPEDYLAAERKAEHKSEYVDGVVYAMAGGSERHNLIVGNLIAELNVRLRKTACKVYPSDMKVRLPSSKRFFYPDVSVVCDETQFADEAKDVITNPIIVVEMLSESTAAYDRGMKFLSYQQIPSLRGYLLISQDEPLIERYLRQENDSWLYTKSAGLDASLALLSVECQVALTDVYNKVT